MESAPQQTSADDGKATREEHDGTGMHWAEQEWHRRFGTTGVQTDSPRTPVCDAAFVLDSAKRSQRREASSKSVLQSSPRVASVTASTTASSNELRAWLRDVDTPRDSTRRRVRTNLLCDVLEQVTDRVCVEIAMAVDETITDEEALRWSLHAGLGTGKSHVIKVFKQDVIE